MLRKFYSPEHSCLNNCIYCFSKWDSYNKFHPLDRPFNVEQHGSFAIYPVCDSECSIDENFLGLIEQFFANRENSIVSISKKNVISDAVLKRISSLNQELAKQGNCIVISVSFSTVTRISEIEGGCAEYIDRINFLQSLDNHKIPHNVIIKPILPFVPIEEYIKIVDDTGAFSLTYVLGDLYVDKGDEFYKSYIKDHFTPTCRNVSWLTPEQSWYAVESTEIKTKLHDYISIKGRQSFESDVESLKYIKKQLSTIVEEPDNIEFELKYSIPYVSDAVSALQKVAQKQVEDIYFDTNDYQLLRDGNFLRIRGNSVDFKLFTENNLAHLLCKEKEFSKLSFSGDSPAIRKLLQALELSTAFSNFDEFIGVNELIELAKISKTREQYSLEDGLSLVIDNVSNLSHSLYLEIEKSFLDKEQIDGDKEKVILENFLRDNHFLPEGSVFVPIGYVELFLRKHNFMAYKLGKYILPEDR